MSNTVTQSAGDDALESEDRGPSSEAQVKQAFQFEESLYKSTGSEFSLITFLSELERTIQASLPSLLTPYIQSLHTTLLKILVPASPSHALPKPGRPIRHLVGRILIGFHAKVESRTLFDFGQQLVRYLSENNANAAKNGWDVMYRVACWHVFGEIMAFKGNEMMSFVSDACLLAVKLMKATSQPVILRYHAIQALTKTLHSAGKAVPVPTAKDLLKQLKNGLADSSGAVQRASAEGLVAFSRQLGLLSTVADIEAVNSIAYKSLEKADHKTRRPLVHLVADLLASTQRSDLPAPSTTSKGKGPVTDDGDPAVIVTSAAASGPETLLRPREMLRLLSVVYNRPTTSRRLRNVLIDIHATLLESLGTSFVETNYVEIVDCIVQDLVLPTRSRSKFDASTTREAVGILLRDVIGVRILSEQGQITAVRELTTSYLAKWSNNSAGSTEPADVALIVVLQEVSGLLVQLGNASPQIQESLQEPINRLLSHSSKGVRAQAAQCLQSYCSTEPLHLSKLLNVNLAALEKDLALLGAPTAPSDIAARVLGKSSGLAAMITVIPQFPLYVSSDITTRILDAGLAILKKSGDSDVRSAEIQVQAAWSLISPLMGLGTAFVKLHLPQLLVLWRNALPKPTSKDSSVDSSRGEAEWSFLLQARESALTAVWSFLWKNSELATLDVSRRISSLLTNTLNFVNGFATAYGEYLRAQQDPNQPSTSAAASANLVEKEACLRRRTLQCFTALGSGPATETVQSSLLQTAVGTFADPENVTVGAATAQASNATNQNPSTIWAATDGFAFGLSSIRTDLPDLKRDAVEMAIEGQIENDALASLCHLGTTRRPVPAATGVIDASIDLFASVLPSQQVDIVMPTVTLMTNHLKSPKLDRNSGRKQAVKYNVLVALQHALRRASVGNIRRARDGLGAASVMNVIKGLLQDAVVDQEEILRASAAQSIGYLSSIAGGSYLNPQIQWLMDQIVSNRTAEARSGSSFAIAAIFTQIGGLNAAPLLRSIVSILTSLSVDPHPMVHFSALMALAEIIEASGLAFDPYVGDACKLLFNAYLAETHEPEGGSLGSSNLRGDLPAHQAICRCLNALIGVIGPELRDNTVNQEVTLTLVHEFGREEDEGVAAETMACIQQFLMFAPGALDLPSLVVKFRSLLSSRRRPLRVAAITALYQIVQKDAPILSGLGGNQLVEDLFALIDEDPTMDGVREVITSWLRQTCSSAPAGWIAICQRIISRSSTAAKRSNPDGTLPGLHDDESQSLGGDASLTSIVAARWRTQLFALQCIHEIIVAVRSADRPEQFDLILARRNGLPESGLLVGRVPDLIRLAFAASTASMSQVRLQGLLVLRDVVESFSRAMDPDFESAPLLEQHQAPITAALTPSFGAGSAPEVVAEGIQVCGAFIGSGIVKEVPRMSRIVNLLTGALQRCEGKGEATLGEVEDLSSNASIMLKIATLRAWAELKIASLRHEYLKAVTTPRSDTLLNLWIQTLRDYALIRADADDAVAVQDMLQLGLARDMLLPVGETVQAVMRTTPAKHFWVLYGLAFEIVAKSIGMPTAASACVVALSAIASLVRTDYCGVALFTPPLFDELVTACYRIALTESTVVKVAMMKVMQEFARSRALSGPAEQVRRSLAVVMFCLRNGAGSNEESQDARATLINSGLQSFLDILKSMEGEDSYELLLSAIQLYLESLKEESIKADHLTYTLPALKALLDQAYENAPDTPTYSRTVHNTLSAIISNVDDMRGRAGEIADSKVKNNLLAMSLILTTVSGSVPLSRQLVDTVSNCIGSKARDGGDLSVTATQCLRTILSAATRSSAPPALASVIPNLLTELVRLIADIAGHADEVDSGSPELSIAMESVRAIIGFANASEEGKRAAALTVCLSTLVLLLDAESPHTIHRFTVQEIISLASQAPVAFKDATNALAEKDRVLLETSVRQAITARQNGGGGQSANGAAKPQISLKSFS